MKHAPALLVLALLLSSCGPTGHDGTTTGHGHGGGGIPPDELPDAGPTEAAPAGMRREPTIRERMALDRVLRVTEQIRELAFARRVTMRVEDRETISASVASDLDDEELARARTLYAALGLIAADLDVRALLIRLLGEQVVGYYDPHTGVFAVRNDVMRELGRRRAIAGLDEAWIVLVHELVHALQDQRLGLGAVYEVERDTDADNAFHALVEGDATLAMIGYIAFAAGVPLDNFTHDPQTLRRIIGSSGPLPGDELGRAPAIVRVPLVSAYLDGMLFCAELHRRGGWAAIDRAHRSPPVSTEQTLHPAKYLAGELPDALTFPAGAALQARGLTVARETTLGELEIGVYFDQSMPETAARRAAAGWGGDRIRVYRDAAGVTSVVWLTTWDDEREAIEAETAANEVMAATPARAGTSHAVERTGRAVVILRDVPVAALADARALAMSAAASLPAAPPRNATRGASPP